MKIERLQFEKKEIEINEIYVDADGKIKERIRKVSAPTGKCLDDEQNDGKNINSQCGK